MTYLFVDTNVLLHYRRIEEIDWLKLSHSPEVVIVLCPAVIRELDHHKVSHPQNKFRQRAQALITSLHTRLAGADNTDSIRDGVRLEFLAEDPSLDFGKHKLRTEIVDDWIIASALEWRQKHTSDEIRLVSADLGVSIKAKAQKLSVVTPLDTDRLAEELDADEKRIKKLQDELAQIKNALPELKICFADGQNVARVKILAPAELDENRIKLEMENIRRKHPLHQLYEEPTVPAKKIESIGMLQRIMRDASKIERIWPLEKIKEYNSNLESFYAEFEKHLRSLHQHQNATRRTIRFVVALENLGSSPAEDVDIHFHFPDGFQLFDANEDEVSKPPEQPDPPHKLGTYGFDKNILNAMSNIGSYGLTPRVSGPPPNVSSPSIRRTNSYDVRCHAKRAKHGYQIQVAQFLAVFDSYENASSFKIDYTILAANIPKPTTGHLSVVIEKS